MKLTTLTIDGRHVVALLDEEKACWWPLLGDDGSIRDMVDLIDNADIILSDIRKGTAQPLSDARVEAPLPRPRRNIICVGKNYHAHAHEFTKSGFDSSAKNASDAIPDRPIVFTKAPETVIPSLAEIRYPHGVSNALDYEAELAIVIGKGGRAISRENALRHVFGYMIVNDVTARDLQSHHRQWFIGKSLDTFCPMGPWIATADEVDPSALQVKCWVNGELRQDASTADLIFDIPILIETISAGMTLYPGDVIATGTPAGVGIGFNPPRYLVPGDRIAIEITGLGRLENRVGD